MDELSILQLQVALLEKNLEEAHADIECLYDALGQAIEIINNNIQSIHLLGQILERQTTARIDWLS